MGKSILDQLEDFAGTVGNDIGGFFGGIGNGISHLFDGGGQAAPTATPPSQGTPAQPTLYQPTTQAPGLSVGQSMATNPAILTQQQPTITSLLAPQQNQQKQQGQVTSGRPKTADVPAGQQLNPTDLQSDLNNLGTFQPQDQVQVLQHAIHSGAIDQNQGLSAINGILDAQSQAASAPKSTGNWLVDGVTGLGNAVGATANAIGDLGVRAGADLTGNTTLAQQTNDKFKDDLNNSLLGFIPQTGRTLGNAIASGVTSAADDVSGRTAQQNQDITDANDAAMTAYNNARNAKTQDEYNYWARQYQANSAVYDTLTGQRQATLDQEQAETDPLKVGGAVANAALNIAVPGAGKIAGKVVESAVGKGMIAAVTEQLGRAGIAPEVANALAPDIAANLLKRGAAPTTAKVLGTLTEGGLLGTGMGVAGQVAQTGLQTTPEEYLNAAGTGLVTGAATGAAIPLAGEAARQTATYFKNQPRVQGGFVQIPGRGEEDPNPEDSHYFNEQVASHSSPEDFLKQTVDQIWQANKKGQGTQSTLIQGEPDSYDYTGRVTISNNTPFYQEFYREYGHAPTKKAITDMVEQHLGLKQGGDYNPDILERGQVVSPFDADIYRALKERQAGNQTFDATATPPEQLPEPPDISSREATKTVHVGPKKSPADRSQQIADTLGLEEKDKTSPNMEHLAGEAEESVAAAKEEAIKELARTKKGVALAPKEVNTARNPYKADPQDIKPGEYDKAISDAQYRKGDVDAARFAWDNVMAKLEKQEPENAENFWRLVEHAKNRAEWDTYSPLLKEAVSRWLTSPDRVHAHSQALDGNTNFIDFFALHPWDLPEEYDTSSVIGSNKKFTGLNNIPRKYLTIEEGEAHNLKLEGNPREQGNAFLRASADKLYKQALRRGFALADSGNDVRGGGNLTLGQGDSMAISKQAMKYARGVQWKEPTKTSKTLHVLSVANRKSVEVLLNHSFVHQYNVSSRAVPGLALAGHPIRALKAMGQGLIGDIPVVGKRHADMLLQRAVDDGTAAKAAKLGLAYSTDKSSPLYQQLMPFHDQVARSVISDLEKRGIPLGSKEGLQLGQAANNMMATMNFELSHVPTRVQEAMGDLLLARRFTPSKFQRVHQLLSTNPTSQGWKYAAATMAGNVIASTALIAGAGYLMHQKSDDLRDSLLRALIDPEVPTNLMDNQGNQQGYKLLATDTSDLAKLLGIQLTRGKDGHLVPIFTSKDVGSILNNFADYARSRLSPLLGDVVKIATNQNYAGKPLYDPQASTGDQIQQGATTLAVGHLPIYAQPLAYSGPAKDAIGSVAPAAKQVLDANTPKGNPFANSALQFTTGATQKTDTTVGKGLDSANYYRETNDALDSLNDNDQAAFKTIYPQTKNPVTGQFQVTPTVFDTPEKANIFLAHPNVLKVANQINQNLAAQGQPTDPFWTQLTPDQQKAVLSHQTDDLGGPQYEKWAQENKDWYQPFQQARADFFNSLPKASGSNDGSPVKPQLPDDLKAPQMSDQVQGEFNQYDGLSSGSDKAKFLNQHPDMQQYLDDHAQYVNNVLVAQGKYAQRTFPKPDDATKTFMDTYFGGDKTTRATMRNSSPNLYARMQQYLTAVDRYGLDKEAGQDQLLSPGEDPNAQPSQKYLKDVYNMGQYDIAKPAAAGGSYSLNPQEAFNQRGTATAGRVRVRNPSGISSSFVRHAASVNRQIARDYQKPHTPSQLRRLSKVVTVGVHQPKIKGSLRVRYRKLNI